jgi:hypothetical protein
MGLTHFGGIFWDFGASRSRNKLLYVRTLWVGVRNITLEHATLSRRGKLAPALQVMNFDIVGLF